MIWQVNKSQLYICGSIHVLKENQRYVFDQMDKIYSSSERIIFESDTTNLHLLDNSLFYHQDCNFKDSIPRKLYKKTKKTWKELEIVGVDLNKGKPWYVANIILFNLLARYGFHERNGIDYVLLNKTKTDNKKLIELEPINNAFICFNNVPTEEQHRYLSEIVTNPEATILDVKNLAKAILTNDIDSLNSYFRRYLSDYPVMYHSLVIERNVRWLPTIIDFINDNIPTLIVVGALHCVDLCGLPEQIRKKGYHVDFLN